MWCEMSANDGRCSGCGSKQAAASVTSVGGVSGGSVGRSWSSPTASAACSAPPPGQLACTTVEMLSQAHTHTAFRTEGNQVRVCFTAEQGCWSLCAHAGAQHSCALEREGVDDTQLKEGTLVD